MKRTLLTAAVALGLAVAVPVAAQQFGDGFGPGLRKAHGGMMGGGTMDGGMMGGGAMGGGMMGRMCENQDARLAGMLAYAKETLEITQAQDGAWTRFTEAARASQQPVEQACAALAGQAATGPKPLPERLDLMQTMLSAHVAQFEQIAPAVKTLYEQLTPEQKQIADSFMQRGGRGFGHHGFGPRGG